jgi:hypothetical protein
MLTSDNSTRAVSSRISKRTNLLTWHALNIKKTVRTYKTNELPYNISILIAADDPDAVDGAPCNIQVIARSEQDEELIAAVENISKDLGL